MGVATRPVKRRREPAPRVQASTSASFPIAVPNLVCVVAWVACMVYCLRGGDPWPWLPLTAAPVVASFLFSPNYRTRTIRRMHAMWRDVEAYALGTGGIPWAGAAIFVVVPTTLCYLANNRTMGSGDTIMVVPTALSLIRQGDWNLDEYVAGPTDGTLPYFLRRTANGIYSSYPAGVVVFAVPVVAAARVAGADLRDPALHARLQKWTAAWTTAASMGLFFLLTLRLVPPAPALAVTFLVGLASAVYSTVAQGLWQHDGTILWSLVALVVEVNLRERNERIPVAVQGLACAMMLACRLTSALFVVPLGLWIVVRDRHRGVVVALWTLLAYVPWAGLYYSIYGTVLGPSAGMLHGTYWADNILPGLTGVFVSPGRGLIVYQPWVLLGLGALVPAWRSPRADSTELMPSGWLAFALAVICLHCVVVATWGMWWGGYCWGSRLLADTMPFFGLVCARPVAALWERRGGRGLLFGLALISFLTHVAAVHLQADQWNEVNDIDNHPERLWSWSEPPFLHLPGVFSPPASR